MTNIDTSDIKLAKAQKNQKYSMQRTHEAEKITTLLKMVCSALNIIISTLRAEGKAELSRTPDFLFTALYKGF